MFYGITPCFDWVNSRFRLACRNAGSDALILNVLARLYGEWQAEN